jgi:hypothetical protein
VSIGDVEPSRSFAIDAPKARLVEVEEESSGLRTLGRKRVEEVSHVVVEGFRVVALLLLQDPKTRTDGFRTRLDAPIDVDESRIHVRGADSLGRPMCENRKEDAPSTHKGFIIGVDLVRNVRKKVL